MERKTQHHHDVPELVESEDVHEQALLFGGVNDGADRVGHPSGEQQGEADRREVLENFADPDQGCPPHQQE